MKHIIARPRDYTFAELITTCKELGIPLSDSEGHITIEDEDFARLPKSVLKKIHDNFLVMDRYEI